MREGLKRTLHMCAIDSFDQSLAWELDALKRQSEVDFAAIGGEAKSTTPAEESEGEAVKQFVAGDLKVENHYHTEKAEPVVAKPEEKPVETTQVKKEENPTATNTSTTTTAVTETKKKSWWPWATALGLGVPATVGLVMAPSIIEATKPPAVLQQASLEYQPILVPGKPSGVK